MNIGFGEGTGHMAVAVRTLSILGCLPKASAMDRQWRKDWSSQGEQMSHK